MADKSGEKNSSPHESYAVILDEFESAQDVGSAFADNMDSYWRSVKNGQRPEEHGLYLDTMRKFAEYAAAEWIQVAAMCHMALK